jgi:hypothetical protein
MRLKGKLYQLFEKKYSPEQLEADFQSLRHKSIYPPETYDSIETMPIWFWWEIERTGNVKLLSRKGSKSNKWKFLFYCGAVWDHMQDQHIKAFGIPQEFTRISILKANLAVAKAKYAVSQDNWDLMLLDIATGDYEPAKSTSKPESNYKVKSRIEVALNIQRIDPRQTTVVEYYSLMEQASELNRDGGRN